ncbi:bile acid:sodium symporter family protein [Tamlana sp. 2_MG-2023]|uniref:bile acid:sodium symporter family protein n=1 Tax=unclassified Tamlana TaxID=2614803 RepID=UPI0026E47FE9|nr:MULTISPECIES: bile acid:sodium symporter family protein [unclassified Tamlana]MDO6761345.1 bile acid:sodium symporter family protein [Tamlana sp. 2_MG-2023]MDO6792041.1 bile acid:sodium symporter family protein [Tamlana sp. 1_MG-2023]
MKIDRFVLAIIATIILAYFFPQWGSASSPVPLDLIGTTGVSLIFFFYGLKLSPDKIKSGLNNWKLHVVVQTSTFLLFPLIVLAAKPFISTEEGESFWLSFLFLAALPSTVSSSVVMVSIAKGNVPAAIFNASISGLIGIVITPLWMELFIPKNTTDFDLTTIYSSLIITIILPVALGILLQRFGRNFTSKYKNQLTTFDKLVILLIIYKSFAHSFEDHIFSAINFVDLLIIAAFLILLFYSVYLIVGFVAKALNFSREDQITAQFCGTKKSLVHGTVFSEILFPATFPVGLILLPLMLFHAMQIFIISIVAARLERGVDE